MRGPGRLRGGRVIDALVSQIDIYPTLCDLIGIDRPAWVTGQSLVPLTDGSVSDVNDAIFSEVTYHAAYEPQRAVRTRRHLYIRRFGDRTRRVLPNCDDGESRDVLLAHGWGSHDIAPEQLHDLLIDPQQAVNRIDDPAYADIASDLRARLDRWMVETDDPLCHGPVPLPVGARTNDPGSVSFNESLIEARPDGSVRTIPNPRTNR
jgi:arylsulfatase A-like enzyme